jgi:hypothetical protein
MMTAKKFIQCFFFSVLFLIAVKVLVTGFFDPKGYLWMSNIAGINDIKPDAFSSRTEKALAVYYRDIDSLIIGSSRLQVGINPDLMEYDGASYNMGLSGLNMYEFDKILTYVEKNQELKNLHIGLDFLMFTSSRLTFGDFHTSPLNGVSELSITMKYILGNNLLSALDVYRASSSAVPRVHSKKNGLYDKSMVVVDPPTLFKNTLINIFLTNKQTYAGYDYDLARVQLLRDQLFIYARAGVNIKVFLNPVHAYQLEAIHGLGLWDVFQNWKRDLVNVVDEINLEFGSKIILWDFATHNYIAMEPVSKTMKYWWESSHYKQATGQIVLDKIAGRPVHDEKLKNYYAFIGQPLTVSNINKRLSMHNSGHQIYHQNNPQDISKVMRWVDETRYIHNRSKLSRP